MNGTKINFGVHVQGDLRRLMSKLRPIFQRMMNTENFFRPLRNLKSGTGCFATKAHTADHAAAHEVLPEAELPEILRHHFHCVQNLAAERSAAIC
jgi:hypothetical protein